MRIITLLTDFGDQDGYVGTMKGVILGICPQARIVDISHQIRPHHIPEAAFVLLSSYRYFPSETIHLAVVDPGVGSERRPLAVRTPRGTFVVPDNGLVGYVLQEQPAWEAYHLNVERFWMPAPSHTFHGRDIFAPVAAHLASGFPLEAMGLQVFDPCPLTLPENKEVDGAGIHATVLYRDRFGNLVTSLRSGQLLRGRPIDEWGSSLVALAGGRKVKGLLRSYAAAEPGGTLLLVGSAGFIEIAQREGNAARHLGLDIGDSVVFFLEPALG